MSIKRKNCKCSDNCRLWPTIGYAGFNVSHAPIEVKEKKAIKKKQPTKKPIIGIDKSQLSKLADKVFADYIKRRDSDINGNIICVCCKDNFNLLDKTPDGNPVVNVLHFVVRTVYSRRYDPDYCYAGCCYCNLKMHLDPEGKEYSNYKSMLVSKFGLPAVEKVERERHLITKLSESDLNEVIEKYKK